MRLFLRKIIAVWKRQSPPIFVVGAGRSGTTLLCNLIGLHSQIEPIYETGFVITLLKHLKAYPEMNWRQRVTTLHSFIRTVDLWGKGLPDRRVDNVTMPALPFGKVHLGFNEDQFRWETNLFIGQWMKSSRHDQLLACARNYLQRLFAIPVLAANKHVWVNKVPAYVECLDDLSKIFPRARFLHIIRDGRDVALSLMNQNWNIKCWEDAALRWKAQVDAALEYEVRCPGSIMRVRFEDLIDRPAEMLSRIFKWLKKRDESAACLEHFKTVAVMDESAKLKWPSMLSSETQEIIWSLAGNSLDRCGYQRFASRESHNTISPPHVNKAS